MKQSPCNSTIGTTFQQLVRYIVVGTMGWMIFWAHRFLRGHVDSDPGDGSGRLVSQQGSQVVLQSVAG